MSTKPTRQQERACDLLAEALLHIAEAARLDEWNLLNGPADWPEIAGRIAKASTAFGPRREVLARALEARGHALGLRAGTAELLTLVESDVEPLASLLLSDDDYRALVARAEAELGEV